MSEIRNEQVVASEKKQYSRPELVKHGAVETLTQIVRDGGSSCPIQQAF